MIPAFGWSGARKSGSTGPSFMLAPPSPYLEHESPQEHSPPQVTGFVIPGVGQVHILTHAHTYTTSLIPTDNLALQAKAERLSGNLQITETTGPWTPGSESLQGWGSRAPRFCTKFSSSCYNTDRFGNLCSH